MHTVGKEEQFPRPVVPAGVGRKHVVFFPGIGPAAEGGETPVGIVGQAGRLDEDRVGEHVDIVRESEQLDLRVIGTRLALNDLAILVLHGATALEHGDAVPGVVIQVTGAEHVVVLVFQLDECPAEFSQVPVDIISKVVTRQDGLVLEDLDMANGLDQLLVNPPVSGVADQIGIVVQETGRAGDPPVIHAVPLDQHGILAAHQAHQGIRLLPFILGRQVQDAGQGQQEKQEKPFPHS